MFSSVFMPSSHFVIQARPTCRGIVGRGDFIAKRERQNLAITYEEAVRRNAVSVQTTVTVSRKGRRVLQTSVYLQWPHAMQILVQKSRTRRWRRTRRCRRHAIPRARVSAGLRDLPLSRPRCHTDKRRARAGRRRRFARDGAGCLTVVVEAGTSLCCPCRCAGGRESGGGCCKREKRRTTNRWTLASPFSAYCVWHLGLLANRAGARRGSSMHLACKVGGLRERATHTHDDVCS